MKKTFTFILLTVAFVSQSQVTFSSLIINTGKSELPFTSSFRSEENNKLRVLNDRQRQYVLTKLRSIEPLILFSTSYPEIETLECKNCLELTDKDELYLITYFKLGNDFLLYLTLNKGEKKRGIMACVNSKSEWISWFVSDGSIWMDDNKSLNRDIDIEENGTININENYIGGERAIHNHVFMELSGKTPDGKYIDFGKFYISP